jgi:transcriptional regulator with XRE-family HTH domain
LSVALREFRAACGKTQADVAEALDWSPSKLLRIENGIVRISHTDLMALLGQYEVDNETVSKVLDLGRFSRLPSLADKYGAVLSKQFAAFMEFEQSARIIQQFETELVPGLLQTKEYAHIVIANYAREDEPPGVIQRRVEARMSRRGFLLQDDGPKASFIIDEAVLWRRIGRESGDDTVFVNQLLYLSELSMRPRIRIQVMPFTAGAYPSMSEAFTILEFDDPADDEVLFLETPRGDAVLRDAPIELSPYLDTFHDMVDKATPPDEFPQFIDHVLNHTGLRRPDEEG